MSSYLLLCPLFPVGNFVNFPKEENERTSSNQARKRLRKGVGSGKFDRFSFMLTCYSSRKPGMEHAWRMQHLSSRTTLSLGAVAASHATHVAYLPGHIEHAWYGKMANQKIWCTVIIFSLSLFLSLIFPDLAQSFLQQKWRWRTDLGPEKEACSQQSANTTSITDMNLTTPRHAYREIKS